MAIPCRHELKRILLTRRRVKQEPIVDPLVLTFVAAAWLSCIFRRLQCNTVVRRALVTPPAQTIAISYGADRSITSDGTLARTLLNIHF